MIPNGSMNFQKDEAFTLIYLLTLYIMQIRSSTLMVWMDSIPITFAKLIFHNFHKILFYSIDCLLISFATVLREMRFNGNHIKFDRKMKIKHDSREVLINHKNLKIFIKNQFTTKSNHFEYILLLFSTFSVKSCEIYWIKREPKP